MTRTANAPATDFALFREALATLGNGSPGAAVSATVGPETFAPFLRRWLERYDAGEAAPPINGARH